MLRTGMQRQAPLRQAVFQVCKANCPQQGTKAMAVLHGGIPGVHPCGKTCFVQPGQARKPQKRSSC